MTANMDSFRHRANNLEAGTVRDEAADANRQEPPVKPGCPGCAKPAGRDRLFCTVCWSDIPLPARTALERAQKALGRNPTRQVREEYSSALARAAGYVRGTGR